MHLLNVYDCNYRSQEQGEFIAVNFHKAGPLIYSDLTRPWTICWQVERGTDSPKHSEALPTTARTLNWSFTLKRTGNCR